MPSSLPTPQELRALRATLVAHAQNKGIPTMDADAVVDAAIQKALLRSTAHDLPLEQRARQALRDERVDYKRRRDARPLIDDTESPDTVLDRSPSAHLEFVEQLAVIKERLGDETLRYVCFTLAGYSEREIGEMHGWDARRAARVRRRLARHAPALRASLAPHHIAPTSEQEEPS